MDNIHPYFKEVLGDKEYTTLLDEYSKKYKRHQIEIFIKIAKKKTSQNAL